MSSSPAKTSETQTCVWLVYEVFLYGVMIEAHYFLSKKSEFSEIACPSVELDKMWEMVQKPFGRNGEQNKIKYSYRYHDLTCHPLGNKAMRFH